MSEAVDALEKQKQEIIDSCTRRVAELDNWIATIRAQEAKQSRSGGPMLVDIPVSVESVQRAQGGHWPCTHTSQSVVEDQSKSNGQRRT